MTINWTLCNNNVELEWPKLEMKSGLTYDLRAGEGSKLIYVINFVKNLNWNSFDTYLLRGSSIWISNVLILDHGGRHHDLHPTQMLHSDHLDLFDAVGERRRRQILEGFEYEPICRSDK